MSYAMTCVLIANAVCIPIMGVLLWQMGRKNFLKWLLIILAIGLQDWDHFILTNVPGFGVHPAAGQKILHIGHTIEFIVLEIAFFAWFFFWLDRRRVRNIKAWLFPSISDYLKPLYYNLAWAVRIFFFGWVLHWVIDLIIYPMYNKLDFMYMSIFDYIKNPT